MRVFRLCVCGAAVLFGFYFWLAHRMAWQDDFAQLSRYQDADKSLNAQPHRVVFLGDSIISFWDLTKYFPGRPYVNRGIAGQTTSQMLLRFEQDVVSLQPETVVILAGTNDIARHMGEPEIEANYRAIAELSNANRIKVVFASLLPVHNYTFDSALTFRPMRKITALNAWLKQYCELNRLTYLDYFSAMVDERGLLKKDFSPDGLHPNADGYRVMAMLVESVLEEPTSTSVSIHSGLLAPPVQNTPSSGSMTLPPPQRFWTPTQSLEASGNFGFVWSHGHSSILTLVPRAFFLARYPRWLFGISSHIWELGELIA